MSKQWGHGYCQGVDAAQKKAGTLVGLWFHSKKDGRICWQGCVDRDVGHGSYAVQLLSWLDGNPTEQKIIAFEEMKDWSFYPSSYDMRYAAYREAASRGEMTEEDFEWGEKCLAQIRKAMA